MYNQREKKNLRLRINRHCALPCCPERRYSQLSLQLPGFAGVRETRFPR